MKYGAIALWVAATALCSPHTYAITKCTGSDGKITFQDAPCASGRAEAFDVKPASGWAPASAARTPGAAPTGTEAARLERLVSKSQQERRSLDLRDRLLPDAERAIAQHRQACADKQAQLSEQQYIYKQNLYGKTHAAQVASEMAAAAALCDTRDRELKESIDAFSKECAALKCRG
jgi:hypothetical protein